MNYVGYNSGNNVLLISSAAAIRRNCGRKLARSPHVSLNCHENSFIGKSVAWEPPSMYCNSICCAPTVKTTHKENISISLIYVGCSTNGIIRKYTRRNKVMREAQ